MPEQKITEDMLLEAAFELLRAEGESALSARTIAQRAQCSVQPIYSLFTDMQTFIARLYEYAREWVKHYNLLHARPDGNLLASNGYNHLRLAQSESNVFHFLYLSAHMRASSIEDVFASVALDGVQNFIEGLGAPTPKAAHELYLNVIVYTHGLASMVATAADLPNSELDERMNAAFEAFLSTWR